MQRATGDGGAVTSGRTVDEGGTLWFKATLRGDNVGTTWGKNGACRAFEPKTGPTADGEINGEYTAFEFEFGPYEFGDRSGGTWDDKNDNGVLDEGEWIKDGIIETTWKDGAGFICSSGERDSNGIRSARHLRGLRARNNQSHLVCHPYPGGRQHRRRSGHVQG